MSVAFRREDDDEHKEPRFELPLPPGPNLVTRRGLAAMAEQVARLEGELAAEGDAERITAIRRDLRYWRTRHSTAEIAATPTDEVGFGSRVTYALNGQRRTIELVGSDEADPAAGRIPFTAPLALAMTGLMAGETADFGGRSDAIEVIETGPIEP
ncbi:GreA/GreB family elongation factor [Sphingomonas sp. 2R-10]|uniref:GreA/GreB family elongation factor n=1 Tax=Sphingomonas sp. 2R-10 TaxID=3045148 RepID=UPI000F78A21B|nr:GreA/GreB family elongation factor [Sphingomonas sp. 2R-10]MDJ0278017.1 GreA/GreB family elongation factor [Sphingomonas sp. 2R-10]